MYSGAEKFRAVQAAISSFFLGDQGDAEELASNNPILGSVHIRHGDKDVNGAENVAIELALSYLKLMKYLTKRGFYYDKPLLLQSLHISYGVLTNYVKYEETKTDPEVDLSHHEVHSPRNSYALLENDLELQPIRRSSEAHIPIGEELRSFIVAYDATYSRIQKCIIITENQR
jgi:hypothetical protein